MSVDYKYCSIICLLFQLVFINILSTFNTTLLYLLLSATRSASESISMNFYTRVILLIGVCFLRVLSANAHVANFTVDHTIGCAPLVVNFTNTSTGTSAGCTYSWNFGNSSTSPLPSPSTTYLSPGIYTVTLVVTCGGVTSTKTATITVHPNPTVDFVANDTSVCPGTPVTFTSTSVLGVPGAGSYLWNFGDGGTGSTSPVTHTYAAPGYYNVTLAATNSQGCVNSVTKGAFVHVFNPPVPNFVVNSINFCHPPGAAVFTNLSTGTPGLTYNWSFGDAGTSTATDPSHNYTTTGYFNVRLIVTDGNGCKDSVLRPAYIHVGDIHAAFTYPASACVHSAVTFTNTSTPHISSSWNFGDGGTSTAESPTYTYNTPGTYTVTLIVSDGSCVDTITHTITIFPSPVGTFTITPVDPCPAPATLNFNSTVPSGASVTWVFGDGGTGSGASSSHTYSTNGTKTIGMVIVDANGCKDTITQSYNIYDLHIDINLGIVPSGCVPLTVNFVCHDWTTVPSPLGYPPYPFGFASYTWTFGDGSPSVTTTGPNTTHTYTAVGVYSATVHAVTANGCPIDYTLTVLVGRPPVAGFTAAPTHICAGRAVTFTNTSTGADSYTWIFGDGTISHDMNPIDTFEIPGTFTVKLIAYYNGCPDTFSRVNYIIVDSPQAIIASAYACSPATRVVFGDSSLGDNTHLWIFGDGSTSAVDNPIHDYPALTTYTALLATYNAASGCRDTALVHIDLQRPIPVIHADDTAVCRDDIVHFSYTITGGTATANYWYRDGVYKSDSLTYTDTFHVTGYHTLMLIIVDSRGCYDTAIRTNYILVAKPVAHFTELPPSGCWPLTVNFTNTSTDITGTFFTNFAWTFGDGGTASVGTAATSHTYTLAGTFPVQLIVTDNVGCKDTLVKPADITVYKPAAAFYANNTHPCVGATVIFTNLSSGIVSSYWLFGDGSTSSATAPTHVYTATGSYTVRLVVTDAHGCTDTAKYVGYLNVNAPDASFTMSDTFSICAPMVVNFFNTSTGATSYYWNFGDGNTSTAVSPSDVYTSGSYYTIMLVATNLYGCKDTAYGHANLYGYAGAFTYSPLSGCSPLSVHFDANVTNVTSFTWDFDDGVVSPVMTTSTIDHIYSVPGGYVPKLILSDGTGCQNSSRGLDTIKVDGVFPGVNTNPDPVCLGAGFNFVDSSTSYWSTITSWVWTYDGITSTLSSPSYMYSVVGTYPVTLHVTDAWGCDGSIATTVTVFPLPVIDAGPDTVICTTDAATLLASGGVSYTWAAPATLSCTACNPTHATPLVVTTYTVTGTDAIGCRNTDTVTVRLKTKTVANAWGDTAVCPGVPVPLFDSGATTFTWIPSVGLDNSSVYNPIATPIGTTTYTVIAQLGSCEPDTNYVKVTIYPQATVDAGDDQTLVAGSQAQLQATGHFVDFYRWTPAGTLDCDTCAGPVASMSVTTTYYVDGTSKYGCRDYDSVTIHLYCDNSQVFVPNSFTPNGDGKNDVFYPRGTGVQGIKAFRVYNRWGELLFERTNIDINDASNAWDGSYKGGTPRADVYVYIVEATCSTGEPLFLKGDVTIIR